MQIGDGAAAEPLQTDHEPGFVHHLEHNLHTFTLVAQKLRIAIVVVTNGYHAGGGAADTHLVLDGGYLIVIAPAQCAVFVDEILGHEENGNSFGAGRITLYPRKYRVDDVFEQIIVGCGDEDFGTLEFEGSVRLANGLGCHIAQVRAGVRFGERHGAAPDTLHHLIHVLSSLLFITIRQDKMSGTRAGKGVRGKCEVVIKPIACANGHAVGKTLTAFFLREHHADPTALFKLLHCLVKTFGDRDFSILKRAAFLVTFG
ncbi:hypothetical protein SMITH_695 [Smithella sp. ME-1]|nr:hypothetical protein SMITH_695 [Smithella sp. ME-1]